MNIIKLKDIIANPTDDLCGHINPEEVEGFNKYLKGKYAFWVHMRYIIPFEHMNIEQYIGCEIDIDNLLNIPNEVYCDPNKKPFILDTYGNCWINDYINDVETDRINEIDGFIKNNEFMPDSDITIDEIKVFRTWLAKTLLKLDKGILPGPDIQPTDKDTTNMLMYYANGMYDSVIGGLTDMSQYNTVRDSVSVQCACCGTSADANTIYNKNINVCDPIATYRSYIYNKMVATFSEIDYWTKYSKEFILTFKHYIDNIIKSGLKLSKTQYISNFVDCGGLSVQEGEQNQNTYILKKLSKSLQLIADKQTASHKNYIGSALYEWSSLLYEMMEWS